MVEFYINLFEQEDYSGTNRPHFKALFKIDGVEHECAFWPNKGGKKGLSGKAKPKVPYQPKESASTGAIVDEVKKVFPGATETLPDDPIPF